MKRTLFSLLSIVAAQFSNAQTVTLEDFETADTLSTSFTSNDQTFNITTLSADNLFDIYGRGEYGWNGTANDHRFIDNSDHTEAGTPGSFSISSDDGTNFYVHSFWVYPSRSTLGSLGTGGSITITGKLGGSTQFTATSSTGFNTSATTNNGYSLIDLTTYGGSNNTDALIDEIVITGGGLFEYIALDAFKWETGVPVPAATITANPLNTNTCIGATASFSITASDATSYQWQVNAGAGYSNITDGAVYAGAATNTLNITGATGAMNGYLYRCVASNSSGSATSTGASLSVPTITLGGAQYDVSCNGGSNGFAIVTAAGGIEPYNYSWTGSSSTAASATGLSAGNYTVTVIDNTGCSETLDYTITQPTAITASATAADAFCHGSASGVGLVAALGGTGGYTYSWSPSGGTNAFASGLTAGTYTVTITDANSCNIEKEVVIAQPAAVTGTDIQSICVGEAYTFNGIAYTISNNTATDTIKIAGGCDSIVTLNLTVNTNGLVDESSSATADQYDGEANTATTDCKLIATVYSGNDLGTVTTDVTVGALIESTPFVSRYYDIQTTTAPTGAVSVTLYFTQAEIDEYNALVGIDNPDYPQIGAGGENAQVTAFHSIPGSGDGIGGYDTATANVEVLPCTLAWNGTDNRWEATFSTTRFSGFFLHTNTTGEPLPILLRDFHAKNAGFENHLNWSSTQEEENDIFVIERATDGKTFTKIAEVKAKGITGSNYNFSDVNPFGGVNYYRLLLLNNDGTQSYSNIVQAIVQDDAQFALAIHPNPFTGAINVAINGKISNGATLTVVDIAGKVICDIPVKSERFIVSMPQVAPGIYYVRYADSQRSEVFKVIKE